MTLCDNYHDRDVTQNEQMPRKVAFNSNFLKEVILEMSVQTIEIGHGWSEVGRMKEETALRCKNMFR